MATVKRKRKRVEPTPKTYSRLRPTPKEDTRLRKEATADLMLLCERLLRAHDGLSLSYTIAIVAHQARALELGFAFDEGYNAGAYEVKGEGYNTKKGR